jgi:hypothetical protein
MIVVKGVFVLLVLGHSGHHFVKLFKLVFICLLAGLIKSMIVLMGTLMRLVIIVGMTCHRCKVIKGLA